MDTRENTSLDLRNEWKKEKKGEALERMNLIMGVRRVANGHLYSVP